ncbi:MAG TPA: NBR1-Ig-like domain-containing protein [Anaerolineales bacterium]|nr:NBR1-Ig-like domain-containing protein [Anaerolineales bacterium]
MKKITLILTLGVIVSLVACNLPGGQPTVSPDAVYTQAAQTVNAELTKVAAEVSPTPVPPTNTFTPVPTNTAVSTATNTPIPCNLAGFISDVTIPDNTAIGSGQAFTKTWRLRNIGTCTWTPAYTVSFINGDSMGLPAGYSQSLTSVPVPPGGTVDITVNLTAPVSNGTYTGNWSMREPGGQLFGTNFIVKIKVFTSVTVTLTPVVGESGTIRADAGPWPDYTAGESNSDITKTCQAFLSFDISGIPSNAAIQQVKINFSAYTTEGNPFGLGILNAYITSYGSSLEPADFVAGFPGGNIADWGSTSALNNIEASPELKNALQARLGSGRLQLRIQFAASNGDATKDRLTLTSPSLVVTYTKP